MALRSRERGQGRQAGTQGSGQTREANRLADEWKRNYTGKLRRTDRWGKKINGSGDKDKLSHRPDSWMEKIIDRLTDRWAGGFTEDQQEAGQPARWVYGETEDRRTDRQTGRHGSQAPPVLVTEADLATGLNFPVFSSYSLALEAGQASTGRFFFFPRREGPSCCR